LADVINSDERARAPFDGVARALVRGLASKSESKPARPQLPTL
jgi:ATP-binding protein involved in chromosome partitioning